MNFEYFILWQFKMLFTRHCYLHFASFIPTEQYVKLQSCILLSAFQYTIKIRTKKTEWLSPSFIKCLSVTC